MQIPLSKIKVKNRQRSDFGDVEGLAKSISERGLINPLTITEEGDEFVLIAGERRLRALQSLDWTEAPCRLFENLEVSEQKLIELEENIKRKQLTWQEEADAIAQLNTILGGDIDATAERAGIAKSYVYKNLRANRALQSGDEKIQKAATLETADRIRARKDSRKTDELFSELQVGEEPTPPSSATQMEEEVLNADFTVWAQTYSGEKFNLLHCDFPYGIDYDKAKMGQVETWGAYDDSFATYEMLCNTLALFHKNFMAPKFHVIFWFSMVHYTWTYDFFTKAGFSVDPRPLIWHKTDNKGMAADANRRYRNIYETAFLMSFGDRLLAHCPSNVYGCPTYKSGHISEKPEAMLKHFLSGVCDEYSKLLDPTCGGGSALRAAHALKANRLLGLELDQDYCDFARGQLRRAKTLDAAAKSVRE